MIVFCSLEAVLQEGKKASNVDIQLMLETSLLCQSRIQQLAAVEKNSQHKVFIRDSKES
ncbi:hypothetical protein DPMN_002303 [Dreissena polymorpha]|uniref:Uncharacterized protein n=1 Tax=Dreissena polymorpha TaxID=45954 RepID=A0A9D4MLQ5_DREPO|nr:hypothetical protein DPMN_002303 [Dreissena polymorpha]